LFLAFAIQHCLDNVFLILSPDNASTKMKKHLSPHNLIFRRATALLQIIMTLAFRTEGDTVCE
jgi:hypothetical protein